MDPTLQPPVLRPPGTATPPANRSSDGNGPQKRLMWIVISLFIALAFAVLILLPSIVDQGAESIPPVTITTPITPELQTVQNPSTARHDAELDLQEFLRMRAHPDLGNAQTWAEDEWQHALATADAGDDHHGHGRFDQASGAYKDALDQLSMLLESRPQRLQDALAKGEQLLVQNQNKDAGTAFELALALEPDHVQATVGLERASVRDQVLALMEEGKQLEKNQAFRLAVNAYKEAAQLDPIFSPAQKALKAVELVLADKTYQDSMRNALSQLDQGNFSAAAKALDTASNIRPDSPEIKDTRLRLVESVRLQSLTQFRIQAEQYAKTEQWEEAATSYRAALKIDAQATFATIGLEKAEELLQLHAQFDHYLSDTGRLASSDPMKNAKELLKGNSNIPGDEPKLKSKVTRLQEAVRLSEEPVKLTIQSDNETEIAIYHVGRLGKFHNRELSLKPGKYTVTGFCPGYRDVRKVVTLRPNTSENHMLVRCEEKI